MVIHCMHLQPEPFAQIGLGKKRIEIRLFDTKRRRIIAGDTIEFVHAATPKRKVRKVIKAITIAPSFKNLFHSVAVNSIGWLDPVTPKIAIQKIRHYYSTEEEKIYGVMALHLE